MPFITIIRPANCIFAGLCIFVGAILHTTLDGFLPVLFAIFSGMFIAAGGYVINDYFDIRIDRINKPERMLPSGKIKPKTALIYAGAFFVVGIVLSLFTGNVYITLIATLNSLLLILYAGYLKKTFLIGNILVAYAAASTFIYGGLSNDNLRNSIVLAIFAFLFTLLREFIKSAEDRRGDAIYEAKTISVVLGEKKTIMLSILPVTCIVIYSIILYIQEVLSMRAFFLFMVLITVPLIVALVQLLNHSTRNRYAKTSLFLKIEMLILLIILIW